MRRRIFSLLAVLAVSLGALGADCGPPAGKVSPWARMNDFHGLATRRAERLARFSSYDRGRVTGSIFGPLNKDNNNFLAVCGAQPEMYLQDDDGVPCEPGANGYLLAKVSGESGWVGRMWFAKAPEDVFDEPWHNQRLVIYLDDLATPVLDVPMFAVKLGLVPALPPPFAAQHSGGLSVYAPLAFEHDLRVYIRGADYPEDILYYQIDVTLTDAEVVPFSPTLSASDALAAAQASSKWNGLGSNPHGGFAAVLSNAPRTLAAGAETVLFEEARAGQIEDLEIALPVSSQPDWDALTLRMTWDGAASPQVDVPLSAFFGVELERTAYEGMFLGHKVAGATSTLYAHLPMPYRTGARIAIANGTAAPIDAAVTVKVDRALPPEPFGVLHVLRNVAALPTAPAHVVADLQGEGVLAGVIYAIQGRADEALAIPNPMNFLEGDDRIEIDGAPPLLGTGTEEIADAAWYFQQGEFDAARSGAPYARIVDATHGATTHYHWYVQGAALNFSQSLRYEVEYGVQNPGVVDRYASTAFAYLVP